MSTFDQLFATVDTGTVKPTRSTGCLLDINTYIKDGFELICTVNPAPDVRWTYTIHNTEQMFSEHTSWVYFIVVGTEIVKIGETGMRLGIPLADGQPISKSNNRFGRYRGGMETDAYIRASLLKDVRQGLVTLWARACPVVTQTIDLAGQQHHVQAAFHKELELAYLDHIGRQGLWPRLNKARK